MAFWKKKEELKQDFKLWEEVKTLYVKVASIEAELESHKQIVKNLRGLVNRKLKQEEEEETFNNDGAFL